jgi:hypothetical protein
MQASWGKARDVRPIHPPHIPPTALDDFWTSGGLAPSSSVGRLVCGSCSSGQGFAYSFLSTVPRGAPQLLFG